MRLDTWLTRLEKQLKYRMEPLHVVINIFGDAPLPEPHVQNGVKVSYVRFPDLQPQGTSDFDESRPS